MHAALFEPFAIRTSGGREYVVPTADHTAVHPTAPCVIVFLDNVGQIDIVGLDLAAVVKNGETERRESSELKPRTVACRARERRAPLVTVDSLLRI